MICSVTATTGAVTMVTMITMTMATVMVVEEGMVTMVLHSATTEVKEEREEAMGAMMGTEEVTVTVGEEEEEEGITAVTEPLLAMWSTITDSPGPEAGHKLAPIYVTCVTSIKLPENTCHITLFKIYAAKNEISFLQV